MNEDIILKYEAIPHAKIFHISKYYFKIINHNQYSSDSITFFFKELPQQILLRKKNTYNNINQRCVNHRNRIQNFYNLLVFLAADGGWPPAATFTLVHESTMLGHTFQCKILRRKFQNIYLGIQYNYIQYSQNANKWCFVLFTKIYQNTNISVALSNRFQDNCPRRKLPPNPNFNANPKPNPNPNREAISLLGNFLDTFPTKDYSCLLLCTYHI